MKAKTLFFGWLAAAALLLGGAALTVFRVDPFLHYHLPDTGRYYYKLDNQRSQNYGIVSQFDYDGLITGTSMTNNFKTSEAEALFGGRFVKASISGASFREIHDLIARALRENPRLKTVIRSVDITLISNPWDYMRTDLGKFPTYLYDDNPWNDVSYLLNRDVLAGRVVPMMLDSRKAGFLPGITPFDEYEVDRNLVTGLNHVCPYGYSVTEEPEEGHLTEEEKAVIRENIRRNILDLAEARPDVEFYCFFSPFSIDAWNGWRNRGMLTQSLETKAYAAQLLAGYDNIRLFSFDSRTDITADLNNYLDDFHYAPWVNSLILKWMRDGFGELTEENLQAVLQQEYDYYTTLDYAAAYDQEDYEADLYAAALVNRELTGAEPLPLPAGTVWQADLDKGYRYLSFYILAAESGEDQTLTVSVLDAEGKPVKQQAVRIPAGDAGIHHAVVDLGAGSGQVSIEIRLPDPEPGPEGVSIRDAVLY